MYDFHIQDWSSRFLSISLFLRWKFFENNFKISHDYFSCKPPLLIPTSVMMYERLWFIFKLGSQINLKYLSGKFITGYMWWWDIWVKRCNFSASFASFSLTFYHFWYLWLLSLFSFYHSSPFLLFCNFLAFFWNLSLLLKGIEFKKINQYHGLWWKVEFWTQVSLRQWYR